MRAAPHVAGPTRGGFGQGPIELSASLSHAMGARVIAIKTTARRLELAQATLALDTVVSEGPVRTAVQDLTRGMAWRSRSSARVPRARGRAAVGVTWDPALS